MASTNNSLNNASSTAIANTVQTFTIDNSDNTGSSAAQVIVSVGGSSTSGDPQSSFIVTSVNTWSMGIDNSSSDNFVIAKNASLGTFNSHVITTDGINTLPLQPCFLAVQTNDATNATGAFGVEYTFGTTPITEVFDKGSNLSTGGVFTAPVTGQYMLIGSATLSNCVSTTQIRLTIDLSAGGTDPRKVQLRPASATDISANIVGIVNMAAGSNAQLRILGSGEANFTLTVVGGTSNAKTFFAGYLMC